MIDHAIDDAVEQNAGTFGQDVLVAGADVELGLNRPGRRMVHRDEEIAAQEEVDVVRGDPLLPLGRLDAVENQVEKALVGLNLRMVHLGERILDGQLVEVKDVMEQVPVGVGRGQDVHPDRLRRRRRQPGRIHRFDDKGLAIR